MNKKERYLTEKGIKYLSQLQEKEKLKLDVIRSTLQNLLLGAITFWITCCSIAVIIVLAEGNDTTKWVFLIIGSTPIVIWFIYLVHANNKMGKIEKDVQRIEEKIKKMYGQLGVNINKLK